MATRICENKMNTNLIQTSLLVAVLLALPAVVQAQFTYTTDNSTITIGTGSQYFRLRLH
jgi:hypothetical protein